jgi:superfamily II DNA or RNA helicase
MGSAMMVRQLAGQIQKLPYRLGLSATPDREYDEEGNQFIEREIGPVIFRFGLADAIRRGILCEFDYTALPYAFSDEDREAVRQAFRRHSARQRNGEAASDELLHRDLARVRKRSRQKLEPFATLIAERPELLSRAIIFVEDADYGLFVQDLLMPYHLNYHTYYGDDDRTNLTRFIKGQLDCLITCHRLSEGIDISSLNSVILFSAARARLETVQRLGRCLRLDPANPAKRANVVDFIRREDGRDGQDPELDADDERATWLTALSRVRTGSADDGQGAHE